MYVIEVTKSEGDTTKNGWIEDRGGVFLFVAVLAAATVYKTEEFASRVSNRVDPDWMPAVVKLMPDRG